MQNLILTSFSKDVLRNIKEKVLNVKYKLICEQKRKAETGLLISQ